MAFYTGAPAGLRLRLRRGPRRREPDEPQIESRVVPQTSIETEESMSEVKVDKDRRTWIAITCGAGAIGGAAVAVPFVSSFAPSERAKAAGAPVKADISALRPGEKMTVEWRGKPVWIVRRTEEQLASLKLTESSGLLADRQVCLGRAALVA